MYENQAQMNTGYLQASQLHGAMQGAPTPVQPTLVSVSAGVDELLKRLSSLAERANGLATAIGGPFPVGSDAGSAEPPASSAIESLDRRIRAANNMVADIGHAIDAMGRSLGA